MDVSRELEDQRRAFAEKLAYDQTNAAPRYTDLSEFPTYLPQRRTFLGKTESGQILLVVAVVATLTVAEFLGLRDMAMMAAHLVRRWLR